MEAAKRALRSAPPSAIEYFVGESIEPGQPAVSCWDGDELARLVLCAAGPHIAADALRLAAEELSADAPLVLTALAAGAYLRRRADQLDGYQPEPDTREGILAAAGPTEADMAERGEPGA